MVKKKTITRCDLKIHVKILNCEVITFVVFFFNSVANKILNEINSYNSKGQEISFLIPLLRELLYHKVVFFYMFGFTFKQVKNHANNIFLAIYFILRKAIRIYICFFWWAIDTHLSTNTNTHKHTYPSNHTLERNHTYLHSYTIHVYMPTCIHVIWPNKYKQTVSIEINDKIGRLFNISVQ